MEEKISRRQGRERAFLLLFSATFGDGDIRELINQGRELGENAVDGFGEELVLGWFGHSEEIDALIEARLRGWKLNRIPRVSLCALRLAISEMLYGEEKLPSVAINEAVELTKKYGGEDDYQFVNGVLGNVARDLGLADVDGKGSAAEPAAPAAGQPAAEEAALC